MKLGTHATIRTMRYTHTKMNSVDASIAYLSLFVDTITILAWIIYKYGLRELIPLGNVLFIVNGIRILLINPYIAQKQRPHLE